MGILCAVIFFLSPFFSVLLNPSRDGLRFATETVVWTLESGSWFLDPSLQLFTSSISPRSLERTVTRV